MDTAQYLAAGGFVDSGAPQVIALAKEVTHGASDADEAILRLYTAVRDGIVYDPYVNFADPANYRASTVLARGARRVSPARRRCSPPAHAQSACRRASAMPTCAMHFTSRRLYDLVKTDIFMWHSFTELYLSGRWVKATPAFDSALCERAGIKLLDFDGKPDSLFQLFDLAGRLHMEYLRDRFIFADAPFDVIHADSAANHPEPHGQQGHRRRLSCGSCRRGPGRKTAGRHSAASIPRARGRR